MLRCRIKDLEQHENFELRMVCLNPCTFVADFYLILVIPSNQVDGVLNVYKKTEPANALFPFIRELIVVGGQEAVSQY